MGSHTSPGLFRCKYSCHCMCRVSAVYSWRKTYTLYRESATILGLYERLTKHLHRLQAHRHWPQLDTTHTMPCARLARRRRLETRALQSIQVSIRVPCPAGSLLPYIPVRGGVCTFDEGLAIHGGEIRGHKDKLVIGGEHGDRVVGHGVNVFPALWGDQDSAPVVGTTGMSFWHQSIGMKNLTFVARHVRCAITRKACVNGVHRFGLGVHPSHLPMYRWGPWGGGQL